MRTELADRCASLVRVSQSVQAAELDAPIAAALRPFAELRVVYLFGSQLGDRARPDSDLDLALSFDRSIDATRRAELMLDLVVALTRALGPLGERADLLDLDRSSSTVGFRAIREGRCVFAREPAARIRLEATLARRYDDERTYRELFRKAARAASERMRGAGRG